MHRLEYMDWSASTGAHQLGVHSLECIGGIALTGLRRSSADSIVRKLSCISHDADFIVWISSCGFRRADSIVRIHRADSNVWIPLCGFPYADSIHCANSIAQIPSCRFLLCGFCHADSIARIRLCRFHRANFIEIDQIISTRLFVSHSKMHENQKATTSKNARKI